MTERSYQQDGLVISVEQHSGAATVSWKGVSDARFPGQSLDPLIREWAEKLADMDVTLDLRELESMNSATVMPLIQMVKQLDASAKQVHVLLLDVDWQRTHGNCMKAIARTLKNVQVERQPLAQQ